MFLATHTCHSAPVSINNQQSTHNEITSLILLTELFVVLCCSFTFNDYGKCSEIPILHFPFGVHDLQGEPTAEAVIFIKVSSCWRGASSFVRRISQEYFLLVAIVNSLIFLNSWWARSWAAPFLVGIRELQVGLTIPAMANLLLYSGLIRNEEKESSHPGKIWEANEMSWLPTGRTKKKKKKKSLNFFMLMNFMVGSPEIFMLMAIDLN